MDLLLNNKFLDSHIHIFEGISSVITSKCIVCSTQQSEWDIISKFKNGEIALGLVDGILKAGQQLKKHFPYKKGDSNEIPDEISIG